MIIRYNAEEEIAWRACDMETEKKVAWREYAKALEERAFKGLPLWSMDTMAKTLGYKAMTARQKLIELEEIQ
jgi:hypothetical protein